MVNNVKSVRGDNMTTVAVDLDVLNELFDNQKKLDDVFDSMFDEDPFSGSSTSFSDHAEPGASTQKGGQGSVSFDPNEDLPYYSDDKLFEQKNRSIFSLVAPVAVEVAAIYYGFSYFT